MNFENLLALDARISKQMRVAESPGMLRTIAAFFAHSGDSWFCIAVLALVWWRGTPIWNWRATILIIAIIITAVIVLVMKFAIRRQRPEGDWGEIYRTTDPHSFPSGHATRAFMLATMAVGLGPIWFAIALIIWAPLVAIARVAMGVHYVSDVVAGLGIGVFMGIVIQLVLL
ncbi:MAG: phosphatase PAP2 family protein [Anaerolineales bacterium]|nr:phosphatase PAP2 family protein [Anaerolineales bacterium]